MSWVWKADQPLLSEEEIARRVHGVSLARGLDDLATVLDLMCIRQESNFWCPWNRKDPTSENYDHDSESNDGRSVGYHQQQNKVPGENPTGPGENWWGSMASRMSLEHSSDTFLSRLPDDYHSAANDPHQAALFIQRVQGSFWDGISGHPGDYGVHWNYCWDLLQRAQAQGPIAPVPPAAPVPIPVSVLRPDFQERQMFGWGSNQRSRKPINFFIHTQEGSWDATAEDLAVFCQGQNDVSYHYTLRDGILYDVVDTDLYCWAVLNANVFSINLCFAGSSVTQTRQQWLDRYGRDIEIAAYIAVQDARKYGFSTEVIPPQYDGNPRPGISDHKYVTQKLGIGTHVDVGNNFPWDVLKAHVDRFATGIGEDDVPTVKRPSGSIYRDSNEVMPWEGTEMDFVIDAANHEGRVEQLAKDGDPRSVELVRRTAEGRSPVNNSLSDDDRAHAKAVANLLTKNV
jgi:hypothetical protein